MVKRVKMTHFPAFLAIGVITMAASIDAFAGVHGIQPFDKTGHDFGCANKIADLECTGLSQKGYCESHKPYMERMCAKECNICTDLICKDTNHYCETLAQFGMCVMKKSSQINNCKKTCKLC